MGQLMGTSLVVGVVAVGKVASLVSSFSVE